MSLLPVYAIVSFPLALYVLYFRRGGLLSSFTEFFRCGLSTGKVKSSLSSPDTKTSVRPESQYFETMYTIKTASWGWRVLAGIFAAIGFTGALLVFGACGFRALAPHKEALGIGQPFLLIAGITAILGLSGAYLILGTIWYHRFGKSLRLAHKKTGLLRIFPDTGPARSWAKRQEDLLDIHGIFFPQSAWALLSWLESLGLWLVVTLIPLLLILISKYGTGFWQSLGLGVTACLGLFLTGSMAVSTLSPLLPWGGISARNTRFQRSVTAKDIVDIFGE